MRQHLSRVLEQPFYLWLLGIYPILYLYSQNIGLVIDQEVFICLAGMLAATTIAFLLTNYIVRNRHKTAFMLGIASFSFSFSGHIYALVFMPRSLFIWTLLVAVTAVIIMLGIYKFGSRYSLYHVTPVANLIVLVLLASPAFTVISSFATTSSFVQPVLASQDSGTINVPKVKDSATRPDIYYIIPDAYPNDAWLLKTMNYDNSKLHEPWRIVDLSLPVVPKAIMVLHCIR